MALFSRDVLFISFPREKKKKELPLRSIRLLQEMPVGQSPTIHYKPEFISQTVGSESNFLGSDGPLDFQDPSSFLTCPLLTKTRRS